MRRSCSSRQSRSTLLAGHSTGAIAIAQWPSLCAESSLPAQAQTDYVDRTVDSERVPAETGPGQDSRRGFRPPIRADLRRLCANRSSAMGLVRWVTAFALTALVSIVQSTSSMAAAPLVFISSFTSGEQGGVHAYEFDSREGKLKAIRRTTGVDNPFFLAISPDRKVLYSIHARQFGGKDNEQVAAYQIIDRTGELKLLNRQSAEGTAACYLDVDRTRKSLLVA